tara:strand:- start:482 stop:757 length:276 start_codon:yes stop_codon:yes gene_type:complete
MEAIIEGLAQYGPLGLWTASLLWMNWQQRKENKEDEQRAAEAHRYHQEQIVEKLTEQKHMLEKAIEKIDSGLASMREKYAEDRILRMKDKQ